MKNWLTPLLLIVSLFALSSCTNTSQIITTGLKVELTKVARSDDGTIHVTWQVRNPNVVSYLVDRSSHKVTLDGVSIGTFTDDVRLGVPAQNVVEHTNVLVPSNAQAAAQIAQLVAKGSASYQLDSVITLLLYDDDTSKSNLTGSGSVPVVAK